MTQIYYTQNIFKVIKWLLITYKQNTQIIIKKSVFFNILKCKIINVNNKRILVSGGSLISLKNDRFFEFAWISYNARRFRAGSPEWLTK